MDKSLNGTSVPPMSNDGGQMNLPRADEATMLIDLMKALVVDRIRAADSYALSRDHKDSSPKGNNVRSTLLEQHTPKELQMLLGPRLRADGKGSDGLKAAAEDILKYSINTWDQGFLDKLYHSTTPVGLASDLLLSALNTNVHTYGVSPALTVVEKHTTRALASMFGLNGRYAGGISQPGGSAANHSSIVIARNTIYPETKTDGYGYRRFVLLTSEHGHYSLEKAAQMCGFGSHAVRSIAVDDRGCMRPDVLVGAIEKAKSDGEIAFYVNATAGTTVFGSFDPLDEISDVCRRYNLWLHVDASWGGSVVFSDKHRYKLKGIDLADSIAICPHKMLGVPITCSLLLGRDLRQFHKAMTLPAGYLFHNDDEGEPDRPADDDPYQEDFWDLADLTPQCGRRGDCLKLALSWIYYGTAGYARYIDHAFEMAAYLASLVERNAKFSLVSENPPPCLQVCFYFNKQSGANCERLNSRVTRKIKDALLPMGFMIDYAPGEDGKFFRVVVNGDTRPETMGRLVKAIAEVGDNIEP